MTSTGRRFGAAERARRTVAKRAEQKRMKRLYHDPAARPEHARPRPAAGASPAGRRGRGNGRSLRLPRTHPYVDWLDERDARVPLTRAELHSPADHAAARAVAAGGGMQAVIEATGLRSRENVLAVIDPAILDRARRNDAAPPPAAAFAEPR